MKRTNSLSTALVLLLVVALGGGCDSDDDGSFGADVTSPADTSSGGGGRLPTVPEPTSLDELMPEASASLIVGLSDDLESFAPWVSELELKMDDGSLRWTAFNRSARLACPGVLPANSGPPDAVDATYVSARPRLLHTRHWRRLEQNTLSPGTSFTLTKVITSGSSTAHQESQTFSSTIGVELGAGAGWGAFSAAVAASYSQTTTAAEIDTVTFTEETSEERSFTVEAPESGTRVYVLWQLVDVFTLVDADKVPIDQSPTLVHARMPAVAGVEFPNESVVTMKTTDFP